MLLTKWASWVPLSIVVWWWADVLHECNANTHFVGGLVPRRLMFARCKRESPVPGPLAVFATCMNRRGSCEVKKGNEHKMAAIFRPEVNSTDVYSNIVWNNGWVSIPLTGQEHYLCGKGLKCPLMPRQLNKVKYTLTISYFWPLMTFPVQWRFEDLDTGQEILCFNFKITIID